MPGSHRRPPPPSESSEAEPAAPASAATAFAALGAHPALVQALGARGYDTPTTVQAAVMAPACAGRDLLVSSQTGSGKTIAFGMLVAQAVMGDGAPGLARGKPPRALVVAPTRELAAQVRAELAWLFKESGARVHAVTGGTDVGRDARNLRTGADIVVGTPGRLVDLLERTALDIGSLAVLVLDEADEMLDLGFREDLEKILAAAPKARRTHLFSATLPQPIQVLAGRYQSDALAVDPRPAGRAAGVHEDIVTVMHLCAPGDRLATVVNVLRAAGERERALVFCSRRDRVAGLCAELCDRGFEAVPLSGEMAQAERTRALAAVRDGRARVLVATNVAARGLDLPELGLVVHADLPEDPDALLHRSGRTGRAGRKGRSVVIAETTERNRAERLLRGGHIQPRWTAAPAADEIQRADRERLAAEIAREAAGPDDDDSPAAMELADRLLEKVEPRALLAALLRREWRGLPAPETLRPVDLHAARGRSTGPAIAASGRARDDMTRQGVVLFTVNLGTAKGNAQPGWLLPLICRRGDITRRDVGAIRVGMNETVFEISAGAAPAFAAACAEGDPRAPSVFIRPLDGPPPALGQMGRPDPRSRPDRRPRPDHAPRPRAHDRDASPRPVAPVAPPPAPPAPDAPPASAAPASAAPPARAHRLDSPRPAGARPDRPRPVGPPRDGPRRDGARPSGPGSDSPRPDRPGFDRPRSDRPRSDGPRPTWRPGGPRSDEPRSDGPRSDGPRPDRPHSDGPRPTWRPGGPRPPGSRPSAPRPEGPPRPAAPRSGSWRPGGTRPGGPRPDGPRPGGPRGDGSRPSGPRPSGSRPGGPRPDGPRPSHPGGKRPGGFGPPKRRPG